ncbi:MAG: hypothetical protein JNM21_01545 [Taibaiella sp.]|nr:hypothetical protein [Taibaiella sp.]
MNFIESLSNYVLENLTTKDLPKIGEIALSEQLESESACILAGMIGKDNSFEIVHYFNSSLKELNMKLPERAAAARLLTKYYLHQIVQNPQHAFEIMIKIDNEIYKKINLDYSNQQYVGAALKLEHLYTWYREIQDWRDGGRILYYNDLPRQEQLKKFETLLVAAAKDALNEHYLNL